MEALQYVILGLLALGGVGLGLIWAEVIARVVRTRRDLPSADRWVDGARSDPPSGRVCVVVPAHNEEGKIGRLVRSLRRQTHPDLRVVLCLDRCTDNTLGEAREAIGEDDRFEIIEIASCPSDWAGKVNAVHTGVETSEGAREAEWLLFTDADTSFDPECVRAALAIATSRSDGLVSLLSTLTNRAWFERVVQPMSGLELVRQYPLLKASQGDARERRAFANGQFMLFRRDVYDAIGGHEAVHDALLEDIALAEEVRRSGAGASLLLAGGMVRCSMYDDWAEYRRGWKRIYTESARRKSDRLRKNARVVRTMGTLAPLVGVGAVGVGLAMAMTGEPLGWIGVVCGAFGLLLWVLGVGCVLASGGAALWTALLTPLGAWLTGSILREAARDLDEGRPTSWGGREYARPPR